MSKKRQLAIIFWIIITIIPIIGVLIGILYPDLFFAEQKAVRDFLSTYGFWGILIFIFIQIVQVVIAPISHYTTSVMGGFLYGPLWGGVINWIGRVIGHLIAYALAAYIGRPIAEKFVDPTTMNKFDHIIKGDDKTLWSRSLALFLMIFLPVFPDDELSYLAGLAKFKFKYFFAITLLGHLGGSFALAYAGSGINTRDAYFWVIMAVTFILVAVLIVVMFRMRKQSNVTQ